MITEIQAKKVLTYHENGFPTNWDVNPYRGCTIGCKYCFAQYSHKYLGMENFSKDILVKTNVAECLEKELGKRSWRHEQIKIGGTTDLYQHSEKKYELLPQIYDVVKRHRTPVFIQTKSILLLRDYEIIRELAKITTVDIATSISTFDESVRKVIEPGAASALERMEMLRKFSKICHSTTVGFMPVIPMLSDTDENMDTIFRLTKEFELDNIVTSFLFLRGDVKPKFFKTIQTHFPEMYSDFVKLYTGSNVNSQYMMKTNLKLHALRRKYELNGVFRPVQTSVPSLQLSLF